jgi:Coenzyme PQQ synthesis protein D (PqqD)
VGNDLRRLPAPNPQVIHRSLPDGAVLFSTADEVYFGLNAVASRVWELLPPVLATVGELCTTLQAEYPDVPSATIRSDVLELLDHLEANALILPNPVHVIHAEENVPANLQAVPAAALRAG